MEFEFDREKSRRNKAKHGITFVEAQRLWDDPEMLEVPARTSDEVRHLVVGRIEAKHWSAVITYREHRARIISVRRRGASEIQICEGT